MDGSRRRGVLGRVVAGVVLALGLLAVVRGISYLGSDGAQAVAGGCAAVRGDASNATFATVDCASGAANFRVGKVVAADAACPSADYTVYTETAATGPDVTVCLLPLLATGGCYDDQDRSTACPGRYTVTAVVDGTSDAEVCDGSGVGIAYPEPPVTFCVARGAG